MKGVSEENYDTDDSRGSIVNLVDESGSAVVSYTYTDYGETAESQGDSFDNEIRFTGGVYDESQSLHLYCFLSSIFQSGWGYHVYSVDEILRSR